MKVVVLLFPLLFLAACELTEKSVDREVLYDCENGTTLSVVFRAEAAETTPSDGRTALLPQVPAASGFSYADDHHELRGKGDEVMWTWGEHATVRCTTQH